MRELVGVLAFLMLIAALVIAGRDFIQATT
jgi:hypothetical protein